MLTALLTGVGAPAAASEPAPRRVADIHRGPGTGGSEHWIFAADFEPMAGRVYFAADDGIHGSELWASDGTEAGTQRIADICPGACASVPHSLAAVGDRLYFAADGGAYGVELWISDGTEAGTRLVADLLPGLEPSLPADLLAFGDRVVFSARATDSRRSLWISDGTRAGTSDLGGVGPGPPPANPVPMAVIGGRLFFAASDPEHGEELWATDGTSAGTALFYDFAGGPEGSLQIQGPVYPGLRRFVVHGGELYLAAGEGFQSTELWVTDGTVANTRQLTEFAPASGTARVGLEGCGDRVFFRGEDADHGSELWASDGTPAGTALVTDARPGPGSSGPWELVCSGNSLFYYAWDTEHGQELWISDGTAPGTHLVADIRPGPESSYFARAALASSDGSVFFFADDGATGQEPWVSDGTAAGTRQLADANPGAGWSLTPWWPLIEERWEVLGGEWYFRASTADGGAELWVSDGTPAGTRQIEINAQSSAMDLLSLSSSIALRGVHPWAFFGGELLFGADDGLTDPELWSTDGSVAGTRRVAELVPGPSHDPPDGMVVAEHGVVLGANREDCCGFRLWTTDGTAAGTTPVALIDDQPPIDGATLGDRTLVALAGELWATDGTAAGTAAASVADHLSGVERLGDWIYFGHGHSRPYPPVSELGRSDGTTFELFAEIAPGSQGSQPRDLTAVRDLLFFSADDGVSGRELWATDGTASGTELVREIRPGPEGALTPSSGWSLFGQQPVTSGAGRFFFRADDGVHGEELWVSDGSAEGTLLLGDLFPGPRGADIQWLTGTPEGAFFVANDGIHGRELWFTDGTAAGTQLFADLIPGNRSSLPLDLLAVGQRLYFSAHTEDRGRELWVADPSDRSVTPIPQIAPGPLPSSPMGLFAADGWLWFIANDGTTGFELWRLPLGDEIFADGFESGDTTAWSVTAPEPP